MIRMILALALVALLYCLAPAQEQPEKKSDKDPLATDLNKPASPSRPAPKWVELQDLAKSPDSDKRLVGYRAPVGIKVEIAAEAPAVVNPVALAFADDGSPIVVEWVYDAEKPTPAEESFKFKDGSTRTVAGLKKKKKDVVKRLSSSKKNGVWDEAKVILEDELPSAVLPFDSWLYVAGRGSVRRYKPSKEGGEYDKMEYVARGFAGVGHQQVSGLSIGPDGLLYISCGAGDHIVEGSDGSRVSVLRTGAVFRCRPDGANLEVFSIGFHNPYGAMAFDVGGNVFHADNDGGAGKFAGCRLLHLVEGGDYGWRLAPKSHQVDTLRSSAFGEKPGTLPGMIKTGKGAASGLLIYNEMCLPADYRGLLYFPDAVARTVRAYRVEGRGASFHVAEEFEFLSGVKDDKFRPCQVVTGPDGAFYVVDWRAELNTGLSGDGKSGRILRVSWAGTKEEPAVEPRPADRWAKVAKLEDSDLIEELSSFDATMRDRARRELVKRGDKNRAALVKLLNKSDARLVTRIDAAYVLGWMHDDSVRKALLELLEKGDEELKRVCAEVIGLWAKKGDATAQDGLLKSASDDDESVRRAIFVAMGRLKGPGAADGLTTALSFDIGRDVFLRDGIVRSIESLGKDGITALMALADSGVQKDTDRVVEVFQTMRTKAAFDALPRLMKHMHVGSEQRAQIINSVVNYQLEPAVSADDVASVVSAQKNETTEVKKALLALLATPGVTWGKKADEWCRSMLADTNEDLVSAAVTALGTTAEGAIYVGGLMAEKKLPKVVLPAVLAALKRHTNSKDAAKLLKSLSD